MGLGAQETHPPKSLHTLGNEKSGDSDEFY